MSKLTKNQKLVAGKIEAGKAYTLKEAAVLVKEIKVCVIALRISNRYL